MQALHYRPLSLPNEAMEAVRVMRNAIQGSCTKVYGEHTVKRWLADGNQHFTFKVPEHPFCAANDMGPVSVAGWNLQPHADGVARISAVFTMPEFTRQGLASNLISCIEADILEKGFHTVILFATLNAVPFYRKMGYQDRHEQMLEVAEGHFITVLKMSKTLIH